MVVVGTEVCDLSYHVKHLYISAPKVVIGMNDPVPETLVYGQRYVGISLNNAYECVVVKLLATSSAGS